MSKKKVLFFFFLLFALSAKSQEKQFEIHQYTLEDGLTNNMVLSITEDQWGFLWFGTNEGLCKWDGFDFTTIDIILFDTCSPKGIITMGVAPGDDSTIWAATVWGGVYQFNPHDYTSSGAYNPDRLDGLGGKNNESYRVFIDNSGTVWTLNTTNVTRWLGKGKGFKTYFEDDGHVLFTANGTSFVQDSLGNMWVAINNQGLFKYMSQADTFASVNSREIPKKINCLVADKYFIWLSDLKNIFTLDPHSLKLTSFFEQNPPPKELSGARINVLLIDSRERLWIGTSGNGLWVWDKESSTYSQVVLKDKKSQVESKGILSLYEDSQKDIWVGTGKGIYQLREKTSSIHLVVPRQTSPRTSTSMEEHQDGAVWVAYRMGCPEKYTITSSGMSPYSYSKKTYCEAWQNGKSFNLSRIYSTLPISDGTFWVAHPDSGVFHIEERNDSLHILERFTAKKLENSPDYMMASSQGDIWINGVGNIAMLRQDSKTSKWKVYHPIPDSVRNVLPGRVLFFDLLEDKRGNIYSCTNVDGVFRFDSEGKFDTLMAYRLSDNKTFPNKGALSMVKDSMGRIWFVGFGLVMYDPEADTTIFYGREIGLPSMFIGAVTIDEDQNLWLTSESGVSSINTRTLKVRNLEEIGGCGNCVGKKSTGEIMFGTQHGFRIFHPDSLKEKATSPTVILTDFFLSGKPIVQEGRLEAANAKVVLQQSLLKQKSISLPYNETDISIAFSALRTKNPESVLFSYQLKGYDKDWTVTNARNRRATYTNLPPGDYLFQVKASDNMGEWSPEPTELRIHIPPAPWLSGWAKAIYFVLALALVYLIYRIIRDRIALSKEILVKEQERIKTQELNAIKTRFFANVSHEFRTPLTLILGPTKQLMEQPGKPPEEQNLLGIMYRNANRLRDLINQVLDLNQLETDQLALKPEAGNLVQHLRYLCGAFESLALQKEIRYTQHLPESEPVIHYDGDKLEKIINNLLSNAFKFTPVGGSIKVEASIAAQSDQEYLLKFSVSDTGPGIASDQASRIFDRFYQTDDSTTRVQEGSGIGLALTKELVELMNGKISVESTPGSGATFFLELSLETGEVEYLSPIDLPKINSETTMNLVPVERLLAKDLDQDLPIVLVVEDNADMRQFVGAALDESYQVIFAENGREGLEKASETIPDLIVSDVMMPEMDGIEFCGQIKNQETTSHIPVVLLTARAGLASKVEGYETGADVYLTKPFEPKELTVVVANLIEQRKKLRETFGKFLRIEPDKMAIVHLDEQFLNKVQEYLEGNYTDSTLNIDAFADGMGLSVNQLRRKLKALLDQSPIDLIRSFRLGKAQDLLEQSGFTVSEIAYQVGFHDAGYFTRVFKNQLGETPSSYVEKFQK